MYTKEDLEKAFKAGMNAELYNNEYVRNGSSIITFDTWFEDEVEGQPLFGDSLKEHYILDLGWTLMPDVFDSYLPVSYIIEGAEELTWYSLSNEDDVWLIQECRADGSLITEGENMFFILKCKKDLENLMKLMGINRK